MSGSIVGRCLVPLTPRELTFGAKKPRCSTSVEKFLGQIRGHVRECVRLMKAH